MPPKTKPVPHPKTEGKDAKEWLEAHGLVARRPAIRSSDYESCLHCPFQYYLSRRLNLVPSLRWSAALSRGSWFHKRMEYYNLSEEEASKAMEKEYEKRELELSDVCKVRGIHGESKLKILEREYRDMMCASAWFNVSMAYPVPGKGPFLGPGGYLDSSWWEVLGTEVVAEYEHEEYGRMIAQFDMLLYHKTQNKVFILDLKTCGDSPLNRLQLCPIEFQTQHYMFMLKDLLEEEVLVKAYQIPRDAKVGGMIHLAVQKPTIEFGVKDRDFEEHSHELTRGPRKGQIELRRRYFGEPILSNYIKRCQRWYNCTGEYEHKKPERETDPPVNYSFTHGSTLDKRYFNEYTHRLRLIHRYASCDPYPIHFPKSAKYLMQFGRLSPFAQFYLTPVKDWPGIISTEGFILEDRDEVTPHLATGS